MEQSWPLPPPSPQEAVPQGWNARAEPRGYLRGRRLARWWPRAAALLIDWIAFVILALPGMILLIAHQAGLECAADTVECVNDSAWARSPAVRNAGIGLLVFAWLMLLANWALWQGRTGQSLGKRLLGIRLVDVSNFQPVGMGRGLSRFLIRWVFIVIGNLVLPIQTFSFLMPLWDRRRQTLEDKLVRSVVLGRQPGGR